MEEANLQEKIMSRKFAHDHFIIRSNWVFGRGSDANFVNQILKAIETKTELYISDDQYGSPTSANALAAFMLKTDQYRRIRDLPCDMQRCLQPVRIRKRDCKDCGKRCQGNPCTDQKS